MRCHFRSAGGVRVFIPGCESGANSGGDMCCCPPPKKPEPPRAETDDLIAITVDELGNRLRDLERRVIELERKGTVYGV